MSQEFDKCLARGKIKTFSPGPDLKDLELKLAKDDLAVAERSFAEENYKWSIIQSYYSMFHSCRALIYIKCYREKSHFCLIEAVRTLYVETGLLSSKFLESFIEAKNLREGADYYGDFSIVNAEKLINKAREFISYLESK